MLDSLLFTSSSPKDQTLNGICSQIGMRHRVSIAKQSLDERFNERGVKFMGLLLDKALDRMLLSEGRIGAFSSFSRVLVKDSSGFELPECMSATFQGKGGSTSKAAASIQFEFDLLSYGLTRLALTSNTRNDHTESAETMEDIQTNDLVIRDLGYVSIGYMEKVAQRKAFFISRVSPQVVLCSNENGKVLPINLTEIRSALAKSPFVVMNVLVGDQKKMPCRAIFCAIPSDKMAARAARQTRKTERRGGKRTDKKVLERLDMNIFVTNTTEEQLKAEQAYAAYRLRWQIELVFKAWKSHFKIDQIKRVKKERAHMQLLAALIWIVMSWSIISNLMLLGHQMQEEHLSILKIAATLYLQKGELSGIVGSASKVQGWLKRLIPIALRLHRCEPKKGGASSVEILKNIA